MRMTSRSALERLQSNLYKIPCRYKISGNLTIKREYFYPMLFCFYQGFTKSPMGCIIWGEIQDIFHLNNKKQVNILLHYFIMIQLKVSSHTKLL